jgi:hypothetical protein
MRAGHVWFFDAKDRERVTELCREIYCAVGHNSGAVLPHYYGHRQRLRERMIAAGPEGLPATNCSKCCCLPPIGAATSSR